jgi:hypothetical protein
MRRSVLRGAVVVAAAGGLLIGVVGPALADGGDHGDGQTVSVVGSGSSVHLSRTSVEAGTVSFRVSTTSPTTADGGGSEVTMFRLNPGHTLDDVFRHFPEEFSPDPATAAKGTRDLIADATFRGLALVTKGYPEVVTETLRPGTYYLVDIGNMPTGRPAVTTLTVRRDGEGDGSLPRSQVHVRTVDDRFIAPRSWPHEGTYSFANDSDTAHMMLLLPVKPGTTDAQVSAAFSSPSAAPPSFILQGPTGGNDVVSAGYRLTVSYDLPAGTYVLVCFVADEVTGLPHVAMGMHQVVVLR